MSPGTTESVESDISNRGAEMHAIKELILDNNSSVAEWAKAKGFSPTLVYKVLNGERSALRGKSRNIAKTLKNELMTHKK
jgi:gp16 family phage-associated protein